MSSPALLCFRHALLLLYHRASLSLEIARRITEPRASFLPLPCSFDGIEVCHHGAVENASTTADAEEEGREQVQW